MSLKALSLARASILIPSAFCLLVCNTAAAEGEHAHTAHPLCPEPHANIRLPQNGPVPNNMDGERVSLYFASQQYPIDLYSAFAPQRSGPNSNYCLRYEVENEASSPIERFFWPLATIQVDALNPGPSNRESIAVTKPPGPLPSIEETWVYAFKWSYVKSRAFQTHTWLAPTEFRAEFPALRVNETTKRSLIASGQLSGLIASTDNPHERYLANEPKTFPDIGSDYSGAGSYMTEISTAAWNGKNFIISVQLVSRGVRKVVAPFTYALFKASSPGDLLVVLNSAHDAILSMKDGEFSVSTSMSPESQPPSLYVIEQPITIERETGRACFLAATYSPIPIPAGMLSCKLF